MRYAINKEELKIRPAFSGQRAVCSCCNEPVAAKCGDIISWHWSHLSGSDCDSWAEPTSDWHVLWQEIFESEGAKTEMPILNKEGHLHRADVVLENGFVVELQHSAISPKEIRKRELFYGPKMVWIFDIREAHENKRFYLRKKYDTKRTFRWEHPRKSIAFAQRHVYLDLGNDWLFHLIKMYPNPPCAGLGELIHRIDLTYFLAKV